MASTGPTSGSPDGWGREEMLSSGFVGAWRTSCSTAPRDGARRTWRRRWGSRRPGAASPCAFTRRPRPCRGSAGRSARAPSTGPRRRRPRLARHSRRVRLRAPRRRRRAPALPGHIGFVREGSIVFTKNVEFSRWGTVLADDRLAAAIVDRVVHHGRLVEFDGPSHRLEESLMLGKSGS